MTSRDFRQIARNKLAGNWPISVAAALVAGLLGGLNASGSISIDADKIESMVQIEWLRPFLIGFLTYGTVASIISFIIGGVVELGCCTFFLNQHDGKPHGIRDIFSHFGNNFGGGFCLRFLSSLYIALWSLLFVIPGIVKAYSYAMAPYIMAEHPEYGANECISTSKQLMKGLKWNLFCLDLSFIGWAILSGLTLGIGTLFLNPYREAAHAAFYRKYFTDTPEL